MTPERDQELAKRARMLAFVIAGTMVLWMGGQWIGGKLGLETRYAFLLDLAAIAAFVWALVAAFGIWRRRRNES